MDRTKFLKTCGIGCLGMIGAATVLESCAGTKYISGTLSGSFLQVPVDSFVFIKKEEIRFRKYVVAQHEELAYPISVYRHSETEYVALLMKCTHQGTELQVFGDRLECPAHGSKFSNTGAVSNGPADTPLRTFPIVIDNKILKINLA